ncbi:hypothetical protein GCM10023228_00490 [Brevibacillus fulvus]
MVQIVFSLALIILLIYLLLRFLAKKQLSGFGQSGPIKVIGATGVGNGKSLQIVQIGDALYVIGVGENVTLLRHIPAGDEMDVILADAEITTSTTTMERWFSALRKKKDQADILEQAQSPAPFEQLLEKQWEQVNEAEQGMGEWNKASDKGEWK